MDRRDMWHNHVNYYLNCLLDVDRHIGAVLDALEASGQADNTVIIFTADHGEMGGAITLRQKGSVAFRETVNVPLVIVDPRRPGGVRTDAVGSHLDLVPTILAYAGLPEAELRQRYPALKGYDLSGVVETPTSDGPRGSSAEPGKGCLLTYDMIATIDAEWLNRNAPRCSTRPPLRQARVPSRSGVVYRHAGRGRLAKPGETRDIPLRFRWPIQAGPLLWTGSLQLAPSVERLQADNDTGLYDLLLDPEEMDNLANRPIPSTVKNY